MGRTGTNGAGSIIRSAREIFVTGVITARADVEGKVWIAAGGSAMGIEYPVPATGQWISIPVSLTMLSGDDRTIEVKATSGVTLGETSLSALRTWNEHRAATPRRRPEIRRLT